MDPGALFDRHMAEEEDVRCFVVAVRKFSGQRTGEWREIMELYSRGMVTAQKLGILVAMAESIFSGLQGADYSEKEKARLEAYHAIIPEDSKLESLVDGTVTTTMDLFSVRDQNG